MRHPDFGSWKFQSLCSSIPYVRGNSKDIWIQIFWRNVYLATEYMLKRNNLQQQFHYIFLSSFLVPIWNAMISTDMERIYYLVKSMLMEWAHTSQPETYINFLVTGVANLAL